VSVRAETLEVPSRPDGTLGCSVLRHEHCTWPAHVVFRVLAEANGNPSRGGGWLWAFRSELGESQGKPGHALVLGKLGTEGLVRILASHGWRVSHHDHVSRGLRTTRRNNPTLAVIGPSFSGVRPCTACWRSRLAGYTGPVLLALDAADEVSALDVRRCGADDWLTLPAPPHEMLRRVHQVCFRGTGWVPRVRVGRLEIDCASPRALATFNGSAIDLDPNELTAIGYVAFNGAADWSELGRQVLWRERSPRVAKAWMKSAVSALRALAGEDCPIEFMSGHGCRLNPELIRHYLP